MAKKILQKADERGVGNHGWLNTRYSFSFSNYYDPEKIHFGALRVINDDDIAGGMGFGTHPHDNMEIITIPLEGALAHRDSMGNASVISNNEVQVMSAGTGITHSEFNANEDLAVKLFQIWIFPKEKNMAPRYGQMKIDAGKMHNNFLQIVSPNKEELSTWINQDAWIHLAAFDKNVTKDYSIKKEGNGVYAFVIDGSFTVNGVKLNDRDALGLWETNSINIKSDTENAKIMLIDVPMIW